MPTLYSRILVFYEKDKFRFKEAKKKEISKRLNALWDSTHPKQIPPRIESVEDTGTYQVFDYPEDFTTIIDQLIRNVHREFLDYIKERRRVDLQQSAAMAPGLMRAPVEPVQDPPSVKKTRKRIPIPAYSVR